MERSARRQRSLPLIYPNVIPSPFLSSLVSNFVVCAATPSFDSFSFPTIRPSNRPTSHTSRSFTLRLGCPRPIPPAPSALGRLSFLLRCLQDESVGNWGLVSDTVLSWSLGLTTDPAERRLIWR